MKKISTMIVPALLATTVFTGIPSTLVHAETTNQAVQKDLAFDHVNVVDVKTGQLLTDMTVVVKKDKIADLGKSGSVNTNNTQVVDATGKFLIPGLWDMHTHIVDQKDTVLPSLLANGVTGVRDMGTFLWYLEDWRKDEAAGKLMPEIRSAGTTLDGRSTVVRTVINGPEEARHAVQSLKKRGVDFIKIYEFLTPDEYHAIADEAKKQGLNYVGHLPYSISMAEASDAGQKSFEHFYEVFMNTSDKGEEIRNSMKDLDVRSIDTLYTGVQKNVEALGSYNEQKAQDLYAKLKKNGTFITPTFIVAKHTGLIGSPEYGQLENDSRIQYIPEFTHGSWTSAPDYYLSSENLIKTKEAFDQQYKQGLKYFKKMHDAGVLTLAGTDIAPAETLYAYPGSSLHEELGIFVEAGLTPGEALQTATINPAKFFGREDQEGSVDKGKEADLVLLNANPLEDIKNLDQIESVVVNGQLLDRAKLDEMLKGVAAQVKQPAPAPDMIQIRQLEQYGYKVEWNGADHTVTVTKGDQKVVLTIGSNILNYNGDHLTMFGPIQIQDGRTVIERIIVEGLLNIELDSKK